MKFIWPPIISIIEKRQKDIKAALKTAEKIKLELKFTNDLVKEKINTAKIKAKTIIKEANINKIMILEKAELDAEKRRDMIISQAYSSIEIERNLVLKELKEELITLAMMMAEKIIKNRIDHNKTISDVKDSFNLIID